MPFYLNTDEMQQVKYSVDDEDDTYSLYSVWFSLFS